MFQPLGVVGSKRNAKAVQSSARPPPYFLNVHLSPFIIINFVFRTRMNEVSVVDDVTP